MTCESKNTCIRSENPEKLKVKLEKFNKQDNKKSYICQFFHIIQIKFKRLFIKQISKFLDFNSYLNLHITSCKCILMKIFG